MDRAPEHSAVDILRGDARGFVPSMLRAGTWLIEPFYASAMRARNVAYDRGIFATHKLPRPTISVGNLTTGGTGKTPVVRWLAERFIDRGLRPAILMRGYRADATGGSDEQRMLCDQLGSRATVIADPDRLGGAFSAMKKDAKPDVFILDDGFQHRRAARDFDLALIDATEPFGFGHVLPRGLLREPVSGLSRADAILITRCHGDTSELEARIRRHNPRAPIYRSSHEITGLRHDELEGLDQLNNRRHFLFCGIANPASFFQQFERFGASTVGRRAFPDHHAYRASDVEELNQAASAAGAELLITTEKDWVKLRTLPAATSALPIWRAELEIRFHPGDDQRLLAQIESLALAASPARGGAI